MSNGLISEIENLRAILAQKAMLRDTLIREIEEKKRKITDLQGRLQEAQRQRDTLAAQIAALDREIETLRSQVDALNRQIFEFLSAIEGIIGSEAVSAIRSELAIAVG